MKQNALVFVMTAALLLPVPSFPCATSVHGQKNEGSWKKYFAQHKKRDKVKRSVAQVGQLPNAQFDSWGGSDASKWKPEAILANAVSEELNRGFSESNVQDVLVAVPVQMRYSGNERRVYGDGQTNAAVDLGDGWRGQRPALVATLMTFHDGSQKIRFRFDHNLGLAGHGAKLVYGTKTKEWPTSTLLPNGDSEVEWKPSAEDAPQWGDLFVNHVAFVQPAGWKDWFPIDFRDTVKPADDLLSQIPIAKQKLGKGTLLDPENVSVQGLPADRIPFDGMESESFGAELHAERYFPVAATGNPQGIHNVFLNGRVTATGKGFSTVYQAPPASLAPFKMAYICFDKRERLAEAKFGVPSGGGWHEIGDEAETVINSLEQAPVVFGYANGKPAAATPSGTFAYSLTDIAVVRKLMPGAAIITAAGSQTYAEDTVDGRCMNAPNRGKGGPENRNYHWFIFDQSHEICAVEWVHPNVPSPTNNLGFEPMSRTGCK